MLWAANDHEYGPGKIHIVDDQKEGRTVCGRWLKAVPGKLVSENAAVTTCKSCLNTFETRKYRNETRQQWDQQRATRLREREAESRVWWSRYNAYLRSPARRERVAAVMRRAAGVCEGCGKNPAVQVHHLTYEHVCDEFLWELRAVCMGCHERAHPGKSRMTAEEWNDFLSDHAPKSGLT